MDVERGSEGFVCLLVQGHRNGCRFRSESLSQGLLLTMEDYYVFPEFLQEKKKRYTHMDI